MSKDGQFLVKFNTQVKHQSIENIWKAKLQMQVYLLGQPMVTKPDQSSSSGINSEAVALHSYTKSLTQKLVTFATHPIVLFIRATCSPENTVYDYYKLP